MKKITKIIDENYHFIRAFLITFLFVYALLEYLSVSYGTFLSFISVFCIFSLYYILKKIKKRQLKIFIVVLFIIIFIVCIVVIFKISNILSFLCNAVVWPYYFISENEEGCLGYYIFDGIIASIIIGNIMIAIEYRDKINKILDLFLVLMIIICGIHESKWNPFMVSLSILIIFESFVRYYQKNKRSRKNYKSSYLVPFLLIASVMLSFLPTSESPIKWQLIRRAIEEGAEKISELTSSVTLHDNDNLAQTGFNEDNTKFFSKISLGSADSNTLLKVKCDDINVKSSYLGGIVRDEYLGDGFKDSYSDSSYEKTENDSKLNIDDYRMDLFEKLYNIKRANLTSKSSNFSKRVGFYISYYNLKSDRIFVPQDVNDIKMTNSEIEIANEGPNYYFSRALEKKDVYCVTSLVMNMENQDIINYLRSLDGFKYQNSTPITDKEYIKQDSDDEHGAKKEKQSDNEAYKSDDDNLFYQCKSNLCLSLDEIYKINSKNFYEKLKERDKEIYSKYLNLPESVPKEVYDLSNEITKDEKTNYDKILAIKEYLSTFDYTKEPGEIPEGEDAVYNFLFKKKEGYCSYFASAMAVMLRCIGLPSRYVEGVSLTLPKDNYYWTLVQSDKSHAWTEVYLEGFGWIKIDATPGYEKDDVDWTSNDNDNIHDEEHIKEENEEAAFSEVSNKVLSTFKIIYLIYIFIALAVLCTIIYITIIIVNKVIYIKSDNHKKVIINIKKLLSILEKLECGIKENETIRMYVLRLKNDKNNNLFEATEVLKWYENYRYSDKKVLPEDIKWLENSIKKVLSLNKIRYNHMVKSLLKKLL